MVFEEAMRKYDAKNPMTGHGGRRSLCCSCMTMRMQKRDSFVTGHFSPCMPEFAVLPRGRVFGVHPYRVLNDGSASPADHRERAGRIVAKA